jgi:hypothetical protein
MVYSREVYVPRESSLEDVLYTCTYIFVILCVYVYRRQKDERFGVMSGNNVTVYVEPGERIRDSHEMRPLGPVLQVL